MDLWLFFTFLLRNSERIKKILCGTPCNKKHNTEIHRDATEGHRDKIYIYQNY